MAKPEASVRELPDGSLLGPNGVVYRRTPVRLKRRNATELIASGAPVVTSVYPEGMTWHQDVAATQSWADILPRLVVGKPPPAHDLQWVGHLWQSDTGEPLLVFVGEH